MRSRLIAVIAPGFGISRAAALDETWEKSTLAKLPPKMEARAFLAAGLTPMRIIASSFTITKSMHTVFFSQTHSGQAAQVKALVNMAMNIHTAGLAEGLGLAAATKAQYDKTIAADPGDLDKSGIAELTFPGRYPMAS